MVAGEFQVASRLEVIRNHAIKQWALDMTSTHFKCRQITCCLDATCRFIIRTLNFKTILTFFEINNILNFYFQKMMFQPIIKLKNMNFRYHLDYAEI